MDNTSNIKGRGVGIVTEGPYNIIIEHALQSEFTASNNQAEYETLISIMILVLEIGAFRMKSKSDSQMTANQVCGKNQAKEPQLIIIYKRYIIYPHVSPLLK